MIKVFDLLNKRKRLRVLEDGNQQVQVSKDVDFFFHKITVTLYFCDENQIKATVSGL